MQSIIIINSDHDLLKLLTKWLQRRDYRVKYTTMGEKVISILEEFEADLAIIDLAQKEIVPEIRNNSKTSLLPLLLMTGYAVRDTPVEHGVDDVIEKPFDLRLLQKKVENLLQRKKVEH